MPRGVLVCGVSLQLSPDESWTHHFQLGLTKVFKFYILTLVGLNKIFRNVFLTYQINLLQVSL